MAEVGTSGMNVRELPPQVERRELITGDDRIVYHVGKELPEPGKDFLMVAGKANKQFPGIYCGDKPDLRYSGGERYQVAVERTPVYCIPMHGTWVKGESRIGYPTYNTHDSAVLMQDLRYFDYDVRAGDLQGLAYTKAKQDPDELLKLRFYYSFNPVFFKEPENFWKGNFADAYREGEVGFEDIIHDLMREDGKYEDRVDEQRVRDELTKAVGAGIIPANDKFIENINTPVTKGRTWISQQDKEETKELKKAA